MAMFQGSGTPWKFAEICALLVQEPFNIPLRDIADLTDAQIVEVMFRPRDKEGKLVREEVEPAESSVTDMGFTMKELADEAHGMPADYMVAFMRVLHARGLSKDESLEQWRAYLRSEGVTGGDG